MSAKIKDLTWLVEKPFAHRGLHHAGKGIAENSLSAFRGAMARGVGIELDVRCSADGEAMVFHDDSLKRLTGSEGSISTSTALGLKNQRLFGENNDTIQTLSGVLAVVRNTVPVLIEMKDCGDQNIRLCIAVRRALEGYGNTLGVMSFNPDMLAWFAKTAPQTTRGLVTTDRGKSYGVFGKTRLGHSRNFSKAKADYIAHDLSCLPSPFVAKARARGVPTLSWTVRTEEDNARARDNVDNVIFELEGK